MVQGHNEPLSCQMCLLKSTRHQLYLCCLHFGSPQHTASVCRLLSGSLGICHLSSSWLTWLRWLWQERQQCHHTEHLHAQDKIWMTERKQKPSCTYSKWPQGLKEKRSAAQEDWCVLFCAIASLRNWQMQFSIIQLVRVTFRSAQFFSRNMSLLLLLYYLIA